jgi:hypothetical protein
METMPSAKFASNIVSSTCCSLQADIKARLAARLTDRLNALMTLGHSILNSHHSWSLALLSFSLYRCKTQQRLESPAMRLLEERGKSCRQLQCIHVDIWPISVQPIFVPFFSLRSTTPAILLWTCANYNASLTAVHSEGLHMWAHHPEQRFASTNPTNTILFMLPSVTCLGSPRVRYQYMYAYM